MGGRKYHTADVAEFSVVTGQHLLVFESEARWLDLREHAAARLLPAGSTPEAAAAATAAAALLALRGGPAAGDGALREGPVAGDGQPPAPGARPRNKLPLGDDLRGCDISVKLRLGEGEERKHHAAHVVAFNAVTGQHLLAINGQQRWLNVRIYTAHLLPEADAAGALPATRNGPAAAATGASLTLSCAAASED